MTGFVEGTPERQLQDELDHANTYEYSSVEVGIELIEKVLESLESARGLTAALVEGEPERPSQFGIGVVAVDDIMFESELLGPFATQDDADEVIAAKLDRSTSGVRYFAVDLIPVDGGEI